jgi:hypothetical protein
MEVSPFTRIIQGHQFYINDFIVFYKLVIIIEIKKFDLEKAKKLYQVSDCELDQITHCGNGNKYLFYYAKIGGPLMFEKVDREGEEFDEEPDDGYILETEEVIYKRKITFSIEEIVNNLNPKINNPNNK